MSESKWIMFNEFPTDSRKTKVWIVDPREYGHRLGKVSWYSPWRKYCFYPDTQLQTIFEEQCLRDIADFCEARTKEHRTGKVAVQNRS